MYGLPVEKMQKKLQKLKEIVAIIGSQKVERGIYEIADFNISIGQQPHSEIAALAVFLDRLQKGKGLSKLFKGAKIRIKPSVKGKNVIVLK
jgi:tRNA (cytidine56-2'-O)-methyltransferase